MKIFGKNISAYLRFGAHKHPRLGAIDLLKFIGPGFLITVGFIDPGNWAANIAAGSLYGYSLLWMITLSTVMLIILQHNAAHLGIVSGLCLAEAASSHFHKWISKFFLTTALLAVIATALAEILGAAIGLQMLFKLPLSLGAILTTLVIGSFTIFNSYKKVEKIIIGFVSLIGLSFLVELTIVNFSWTESLLGWSIPSIPSGSIPIIMSVLGAIVMPHNIFLHSEVIQSRQWNLENENIIKRQLRYEFLDTLVAMLIGFAINSAMLIVAAAVFFKKGIVVTELSQAEATLRPLVGNTSAIVFAIALILSGFASAITAAMAGASIFAGMFKEPLDLQDNHSRAGVLLTLVCGLLIIFLLKNPFQGLIWGQVVLSMQLPFTIIGLIALTSSKKIMREHANTQGEFLTLLLIATIVITLNIMLLWSLIN
ncbi:MAG: Nramp family divalent metal transporter [Oligoflexia bacterium]|nr:Nramp family divalent metal transporter [Oligoflexia bacterium]